MGATQSAADGCKRAIDPNPIRLSPEQSVSLLGVMHAKRTLTWADIAAHRDLTFSVLAANGLTPQQLFRLQPDITQWVGAGRCRVEDIDRMALWAPDPFRHFRCNIGDLAVKRDVITPDVLRRGGVTVTDMRENFGLTPDLMALLRYSPMQWAEMGMSKRDLDALTNTEVERIFGRVSREAVESQIAAYKFDNAARGAK